MKILVVGAGGMLSTDIIPVLSTGHTCFGATVDEMDITSLELVRSVVNVHSPDIIINCAAYTNVDCAEKERDTAMLVNATGTQHLALVCAERDIPLCHVSTDYVFNGQNSVPYTPFDNTDPVNFYGFSKLAGEKYVKWLLRKFYIVRTSWLYGHYGKNFVKTILDLSGKMDTLRVVNDQKGSPTWTVSLSHGIKAIIESGKYGIYHVTDATDGRLSWYDFTVEILKLSGKNNKVIPVTTDEFPRPAKRPAYSVLDLSTLIYSTPFKIRQWDEALAEYLKSEAAGA
ncbi:MAG: dTDP-4-dehydrorhamnose reductase [Candidatus Magnetominusculus sp. LBB02]|nr:dTDP-4-dehydrorhamnose reductase [Candidatus Magnetominusculus sp. LBB02]